ATGSASPCCWPRLALSFVARSCQWRIRRCRRVLRCVRVFDYWLPVYRAFHSWVYRVQDILGLPYYATAAVSIYSADLQFYLHVLSRATDDVEHECKTNSRFFILC